VHVPLAQLAQVAAAADDDLGWQVPGRREELVVALIRSLPKQLRVHFVPAPNVARDFLAATPPGDETLLDALQRFLRATTGVVVPREAWDWSKVPDHLVPTFRVVGEDGAVVAVGKDVEALKAPLRPTFAAAMAEAASSSGLDVTGRTAWTFGAIEQTFAQRRAGHEVRGYPALVDEGTTVGLRVLGSQAEQEASHRRGLRRLVLLAVPSPAKRVADGLSTTERLTLAASPYPSVPELLEDCVAAAVDALVERHGLVWDRSGFDALVGRVGLELEQTTGGIVRDVLLVLREWREVDRLLSGSADLSLLPALADMKAQVGRLVRRGFVSDVGADALRRLPRYLAAVRTRRERLPASVNRDRQLMDRVAALQEAYLHRIDALPEGRSPSAGLVAVRWMLEEYRVSLWDQARGTAFPVSDTRIRKALDAL
jgi:ATP-dependent helicase HrpA